MVPLGFDVRYLQVFARADTVALDAVDLTNGFDRYPWVLRRWVMFYSYGPQGIAGSHSVGAVRLASLSPGTSIQGTRGNGRQKRGYHPPPAVFVCSAHPMKIRDGYSFPNGFFRALPPLVGSVYIVE